MACGCYRGGVPAARGARPAAVRGGGCQPPARARAARPRSGRVARVAGSGGPVGCRSGGGVARWRAGADLHLRGHRYPFTTLIVKGESGKGVPAAWMLHKEETEEVYKLFLDHVTRHVHDRRGRPEWAPRHIVTDCSLAEMRAVERSVLGHKGTKVVLCIFHVLMAWLSKVMPHARRARRGRRVKKLKKKDLIQILEKMKPVVKEIYLKQGQRLEAFRSKNVKQLLALRDHWCEVQRQAGGAPAEGFIPTVVKRVLRKVGLLSDDGGPGGSEQVLLQEVADTAAAGGREGTWDIWTGLCDLVYRGETGEGDEGRERRCREFLAKVREVEGGWQGTGGEFLFSDYFEEEFLNKRGPSTWMLSARRERGQTEEDITTTTSMCEAMHNVVKTHMLKIDKAGMRGRRVDWL